ATRRSSDLVPAGLLQDRQVVAQVILPVAPLVGAGVAEVEGGVLLAQGAQLHVQVVGAAIGGGLDDTTLDGDGRRTIDIAVHALGAQHVVLANQPRGVGDVQVWLVYQLIGVKESIIISGSFGVSTAPHLIDARVTSGEGDIDERRGEALRR